MNADGNPMTIEDFYDSYGGDAPTYGGDKFRTYITVENAQKKYLDGESYLASN